MQLHMPSRGWPARRQRRHTARSVGRCTAWFTSVPLVRARCAPPSWGSHGAGWGVVAGARSCHGGRRRSRARLAAVAPAMLLACARRTRHSGFGRVYHPLEECLSCCKPSGGTHAGRDRTALVHWCTTRSCRGSECAVRGAHNPGGGGRNGNQPKQVGCASVQVRQVRACREGALRDRGVARTRHWPRSPPRAGDGRCWMVGGWVPARWRERRSSLLRKRRRCGWRRTATPRPPFRQAGARSVHPLLRSCPIEGSLCKR